MPDAKDNTQLHHTDKLYCIGKEIAQTSFLSSLLTKILSINLTSQVTMRQRYHQQLYLTTGLHLFNFLT